MAGERCDQTTSMSSRTFLNLYSYLSAPFRAFLKIDGHPSLSLTLRANSYETVIQMEGKTFGSVEHLFHHYNKYLAGSALNRATYLANGCQRLLQYLVFEEGPYTRLSVAQTLELSPAEWAEMPPLSECDDRPSPPAENTIVYDTTPPVIRPSSKGRLAALHRRCDAIERGITEIRQRNASMKEELGRLDAFETRIRRLDEASLTLNTITTHLENRMLKPHQPHRKC